MTDNNSICSICNKAFPYRFIHSMYVHGGYIQICPDCALKTLKEEHDWPNYMFKEGTTALEIYNDFQEWKIKGGKKND